MLLKLESNGDDRYRVTWCVADELVCYLIGAEALRTAAKSVRDQLDLLSRNISSGVKASYGDVLVELAKAGRTLRNRLFNDPGKKKETRTLEACIAMCSANDRKLQIYADASIGVPWGLLFDGPIPLRAANAAPEQEINEFGGFWCLKYRLSALSASFPRSPEQWKRPRSNFGMLSLINKEVKALLSADLPKEEYEEFCAMLNPVGEANGFDESLQLLENTPNTDMIVHFLGHHSNQTLILGESNNITFDDFSQLLDGLTEHGIPSPQLPCGLVFLNGCESAVGEKDLTLRWHTSRRELCGTIATESIVRRSYAVVVGFRFLKLMVMEGKTIADTMEVLHHDRMLWPESLIYGCYAHPDYCIEPPVALQPEAVRVD